MPDDRSSRPDRTGGPQRGGRTPSGRSGRKSYGKPGGKSRGKSYSKGGRPQRDGTPRSAGRRDDGRSDRRSSGRQDDRRRDDRRGGARGRPEPPPPRTEAERRAAEVRATRGPRRTPRTEEGDRTKIEQRRTEQWIDEGSIHDEAVAATERAAGRGSSRSEPHVAPEVAVEIAGSLDADRARRSTERLAAASQALDRGRYADARRLVTPLRRELPTVAAVHEVYGLACYGEGKWTNAAEALELARQLRPDPALLPVLADCYRAVGRWADVDDVWAQIKAASPRQEVMTEGRIVAAGALADRGELKPAIELLTAASRPPKRVREHHLRQWYALADLHDRAGDPVSAARWFEAVARHDARFADVRDRLRSLGR